MTSRRPVFRIDSRGVTLLETVAAVMIIAFAAIGLTSSFIYGRYNVERAGLQRRALEMLQGQMEYWKNARAMQYESQPLPASSGIDAGRDVVLDAKKNLHATIRSAVSGVKRDGSLSYQDVVVILTYDNGVLKDSLGLSTKMYLR